MVAFSGGWACCSLVRGLREEFSMLVVAEREFCMASCTFEMLEDMVRVVVAYLSAGRLVSSLFLIEMLLGVSRRGPRKAGIGDIERAAQQRRQQSGAKKGPPAHALLLCTIFNREIKEKLH